MQLTLQYRLLVGDERSTGTVCPTLNTTSCCYWHTRHEGLCTVTVILVGLHQTQSTTAHDKAELSTSGGDKADLSTSGGNIATVTLRRKSLQGFNAMQQRVRQVQQAMKVDLQASFQALGMCPKCAPIQLFALQADLHRVLSGSEHIAGWTFAN